MYYKVLFAALMLMSLPIHNLKAEELSEASLAIVSSNEDGGLVSGVDIELYDTADDLIDAKASDNDGNVEFENIPLGTYIVRIVGVPPEYQSFNTEYQINVTNDNQHYVVSNQLFYKEYSTITFYKKDSRGNPLAGSELTIYDENNNVVEVIVTDENGFAESKPLENGTYYVQETKAPAGYELDPRRYTIYVGSKVSSLEYTSVSDPITATKTIEVFDVAGQSIRGAKFELTDSAGQKTNLKSDKNGSLNLQQLTSGDYTLRLVDSRFNSDIEQYNFSVANDGTISNLPSQIYLTSVGTTVIPKLATTGAESYVLVSVVTVLMLFVVKKFSM